MTINDIIVEDFEFQKFCPVDKDYPIYEVIYNGKIIMDFTINKSKEFEIAIHNLENTYIFNLSLLKDVIKKAEEYLANNI